ncbi:MAG: hypothetical protein PHR81_08875 [Bacteroidales bacterium]|nr:hypothetical protein [Bacteroidales bacterium]
MAAFDAPIYAVFSPIPHHVLVYVAHNQAHAGCFHAPISSSLRAACASDAPISTAFSPNKRSFVIAKFSYVIYCVVNATEIDTHVLLSDAPNGFPIISKGLNT